MAAAPVKPIGAPIPPPERPRPAAPQRQTGGGPRRSGTWPPFVRALISLVLIWHFFAIFIAALVVPAPSSQLEWNISRWAPIDWYLNSTYLNQGHSFFATEVGPGHLIQYELLDQSDRVIEQGSLPS